ncbi:MAG: glycerophosphodiester phosphodiesterase family protein [Rheinheimera sp.]|nr:glycerophosphodiester phosphodiesterase family protein [Rheinheimera sp.]
MLIFAHRGVSGHFPENTLMAFQAALDAQCQAIELDVYALQNQLVVIHDRQLARTTNGEGNLEDHTLESLSALDAGRGESVPTLWQVLQLVANKVVLNIELKGADTAELLIALLAKAQQELQLDLATIVVSSFNHRLLQQLRKLHPTLALGVLIAHRPLDNAAIASQLDACCLNCDRGFVDAELINDAHQRGIKVYVYTVNDAREARELAKIGVDGIFCNYPQEAQNWFAD